jgi:ribosomal protein L3 glutamine methyltransferase
MTIDAQANLRTLRDVLRYAVTRFNERPIFYGHGQLDSFDEAAFLVMRAMKLPLERMDVFLDAFKSACRWPICWARPGCRATGSASTRA